MKLENKKLLPSKIAKYSLMAGTALTLLNSCGKDDEDKDNPNIEATDVNPDVSLTAPTNNDLSQSFDINGDGVNDLRLNIGNYDYSYYGYTTNLNTSSIAGLNGSRILTQEVTFTFQNGYSVTEDMVSALSAGSTIGASQVVWMDTAYLAFSGVYGGENINLGPFLGQDKYVGVSIQAAGNTHYAWMQLSLSADGSNVVVKKHAYHTTPNTAINAGEE
jgi:hypothetical protein